MNQPLKRKYTCVFFDLDHTLWDYDTNARETLQELYTSHNLKAKGVDLFDAFFDQFKTINLKLWDLYDTGAINSEFLRKERFKQILAPFMDYEANLCERLSDDYLSSCPTKCNLMPKAIDTLEYLATHYKLTIITNGFDDIQYLKLTSGKLVSYFDHIITSQKAGHRKPAKEIFEFALRLNAVENQEAIMIGDNPLTDIAGAKNASIDSVLFNPEKIDYKVDVNHEIVCLDELQYIL